MAHHGVAAADLLDTVFGPTVTDWRELLRLKTRFLGYGEVEPNRTFFSEDRRVLMLGWDKLYCDQGHDYSVPLPPSLSGQKVKRRLTVSLAWFSPINPRHKDYRNALLWISPDKDKLGLEKKDLDAESHEGARSSTRYSRVTKFAPTRRRQVGRESRSPLRRASSRTTFPMPSQ